MNERQHNITKPIRNAVIAMTAALGLTLAAQQASMPAPAGGEASVSPQVRLQKIRAEFTEINQQLRQIQAQAMQDPEVQAKEQVYQEALEAKMFEIASAEMKSMVKKRFDLADELSGSPTPQTARGQERLQSLSEDFKEIRQEVSSIEEQAAAKPDVKAKRQELVSAINEEMASVNPDFSRMIARQQELAREFRSIQQQIGG